MKILFSKDTHNEWMNESKLKTQKKNQCSTRITTKYLEHGKAKMLLQAISLTSYT